MQLMVSSVLSLRLGPVVGFLVSTGVSQCTTWVCSVETVNETADHLSNARRYSSPKLADLLLQNDQLR